MTDLRHDARSSTGGAGRPGGALWRPFLWLVLVVSAVANGATSTSDLPVWVGIACGAVALASIAGLVADHYRRRR